jgi:hypothetical protein
MKTAMKWHPMNKLPKKNDVPVLVYTLTHVVKDKFRIVDSQFVKKCTDAILWSYIKEPGQ